MPSSPSVVPAPLIERLRSLTTMVFGDPLRESLMMKPVVPREARVEAQPDPVPPSTVMDFVMVKRTVAAGVERVHLAAGGCLRDRARPGLAGGGAAARVLVVADARDPGARGLRLREG